MLPKLYLKSSWSVAESRHQLSLRPVEVKKIQCIVCILKLEEIKMCNSSPKRIWHVKYHLYTEHSLYECVFQSSAQSDCAHLWCRLLFQEEGHRSEPVLRLKKNKMKMIYSTSEFELFWEFQISNILKYKLSLESNNSKPCFAYSLRRKLSLWGQIQSSTSGAGFRLDYCNWPASARLSTNGPKRCCKAVDQIQQDHSHHTYLIFLPLASHQV